MCLTTALFQFQLESPHSSTPACPDVRETCTLRHWWVFNSQLHSTSEEAGRNTVTAGRPMRSCGWGGGPFYGKSLPWYQGFSSRQASHPTRLRLLRPSLSSRLFSVDLCHLAVAAVPALLLRLSHSRCCFGRSRLDRPIVRPSSFCSMRLKVWWFIAQCSHCHVHLHVRSLSEEKVDCAELKAKYQDVCSGAEERHVSVISLV